ncbi:hypothetical protein [Saccharibacillus alkalitolerans]|uniref:Uncharacterized protein n=1 Tax=Saccharibacillus alkalitolerans TaxID=2705290 RepID=A0ABX0F4U5_9BACL|nr:hypothetical protein [Saccharibacillus alkalitolerans]NGZ74959.1 hypothetical protein [Saccharibacillus alkalitolerans]
MNKLKPVVALLIFSFVWLQAGCLRSGDDVYFRSEYVGTSAAFDIRLVAIQTNPSAPETSTLLIESKDEDGAKAGEKVKMYFKLSEGMIEGTVGEKVEVPIDQIPDQVLNGLDFETTLVYGDGEEEQAVFSRESIQRKFFNP